tara:strand:- start:1410 stop:1580 length:171 start_codon:yes stop_codon:yes gene_type:complete
MFSSNNLFFFQIIIFFILGFYKAKPYGCCFVTTTHKGYAIGNNGSWGKREQKEMII